MDKAGPLPLWLWEELVAAAGARAEAAPGRAPPTAVTGVSIDTRTIEPGDLFVALKDARDGHEFVGAAFAKGAAAALVSASYPRGPNDGALLRVADPLHALQLIGIAARARLAADARVIAVTGSVGKTTTKEMLRACLSTQGATHASEKSYNNHWGVPLTLARMPADTKFGVFEIGMNHAGEITPLSKMVRPHVAVITTVGPVHLEFFGSVEAIAEAKAEIFLGLEALPVHAGASPSPLVGRPLGSPVAGEGWGGGDGGTRANLASPFKTTVGIPSTPNPSPQGGGGPPLRFQGANTAVAIVNADIPQSALLQARAKAAGGKVVTFGEAVDAGYRLLPRSLTSLDGGMGSEGTFAVGDDMVPKKLRLGIPGKHQLLNALAVLAAIDAVDGSGSKALDVLPTLQGSMGRVMQGRGAVYGARFTVIDESYNANPVSMRGALSVLANLPIRERGRRIAILGDMRELGAAADDLHRALLAPITEAGVDRVFLCGPHMEALILILPEDHPADWTWMPTSADLIAPVLAEVRAGDVVMIKGSLGTRMAPILDALKAKLSGR